MWASVNRGKRSVVLDLQQAEGVDLLRRMAATADVFIQNFRPGVAGRLGIDEPALRAVNPGLVYVSVSGFGDSGPYVDQKSYDYVIQALSGMAGLQADPKTGVPALIRNIVVDKTTAGYVTQSVLAALLARANGAGGQHVQVSMIDVALAFLWPDGMMQHALLDTDRVTPGAHMADGYMVRPTADGHLALVATSDRQFPGIATVLGHPEWIDDARFATVRDREMNAGELDALIGAEVARWTGSELVRQLQDHDIPCALINPVATAHLDQQVVHNGIVVEHERPHVGRVREVLPPARFSATPATLGRHAPRLDEHTDEVLCGLGLDDAAIDDLRARGIIGARKR